MEYIVCLLLLTNLSYLETGVYIFTALNFKVYINLLCHVVYDFLNEIQIHYRVVQIIM